MLGQPGGLVPNAADMYVVDVDRFEALVTRLRDLHFGGGHPVLIKWVRCVVTDRAAFDRGQRGWGALATVPGFLGQWGGWSTREPAVAHVIARWRSAEDHAAFLAGPHDSLAAAQHGTYTDIEVRFLDRAQGMDLNDLVPGVVLEPSWTVPPAV